MQQLAVGVDDYSERQSQAEDEKADDVGNVVGRLGLPVHWACSARALGSIFAPAQQWGHSPGHGVEPGEADPSKRRAEVSAVGDSGRHHGAVTLIRQDRQGDQGDDAWGNEKIARVTGYCDVIYAN